MFLLAFKLLLLFFFLAGFAVSSCEETDYGFLVLGFSGREKSLAVVSWVCTFEAVLLERQ